MPTNSDSPVSTTDIIVVTLNPTFDLVLEVPDFKLGSHQQGRQLQRLPAGKGLNVCRTLDCLGVGSIITGFVGGNSIAEFEQVLLNTRITGQFFSVPGHTRQNITILDPTVSSDTHIRQDGPEITRHDLDRIAAKLTLLAEEGTIVVFAGSLPPGVSSDDFARLLQICHHERARVVVDTSGQALAVAVDHNLWLIKPNSKEFAELIGRPVKTIAQIAQAARQLTDRIPHLLISLAAQGALLITKELALHAVIDSPASATLANTVGSGDSLLGAFLAGLIRSKDKQAALSRAVAVSWAACQTSLPAVFDPELAQSMLKQVRLEHVEGL